MGGVVTDSVDSSGLIINGVRWDVHTRSQVAFLLTTPSVCKVDFTRETAKRVMNWNPLLHASFHICTTKCFEPRSVAFVIPVADLAWHA